MATTQIQSDTKQEELEEGKTIVVDFKIHIAIDFGTDGVGLAYAFNDEVFVHSKWESKKFGSSLKPKTIILFDENLKFKSFGMNAKDNYTLNVDKKMEWMLFDRFKMALYESQLKSKKSVSKYNDDEKKNDNEVEEEEKIELSTELTAANGKKLSAEFVFVEAFKYLGVEAKAYLKKKGKNKKYKKLKKINNDELQWIITVPAIWNDSAKNKMKQWAIKAGLINEHIQNQCKIVYEPDCASLSIQYEIYNRNKQNKLSKDDINEIKQQYESFDDDITNNILKQREFVKGEKYILVDAGGGTVDIACHEIIDELSVKEILHPSGGKWGSTYIDDEYKQLLQNMFTKQWMYEFKKESPNIYVEIINNFQKAKEAFYEKKKLREHSVVLPSEFLEFLEEKADDDDTEGEDDDDSDDDNAPDAGLVNEDRAFVMRRMQSDLGEVYGMRSDFSEDGGLSAWLISIGFKHRMIASPVEKIKKCFRNLRTPINTMDDLETYLIKIYKNSSNNTEWIDKIKEELKNEGLKNDQWTRFSKNAKEMIQRKVKEEQQEQDENEDEVSKMVRKHKYDLFVGDQDVINSMGETQLKARCAREGLDTTGNKQELIQRLKEYFARIRNNAQLINLVDDRLVINELIWLAMFDHVMAPTIEHIKKLMEHKLLKNGQCKYLCLVGGFSCSKYYQFRLENEFGEQSKYKMKFIVPLKPDLSVVQGAAYFGLRSDYIKARVLKYTYGCKCKMQQSVAIKNGVPMEHIEKYKVKDEYSGKYYIKNCVNVIARKNETIEIGHIKKHETQRKDFKTKSATMRIFVSDMEYPTIMNDGKVIGKLQIEFDDEKDKNELNVDAEFHFYDTIIKVFAYKTSQPNIRKEIQLKYQQNDNHQEKGNNKKKRKKTISKGQ